MIWQFKIPNFEKKKDKHFHTAGLSFRVYYLLETSRTY